MTLQFHVVLLTSAIVCACTSNLRASTFNIDDWILETGIIDDETHGIGSYSPLPLPYIDSQTVKVGSSQAFSYFDFSWTPDTASFLIAASHIAFDGNGGTRSLSSGNIYITPTVDLLLTATGGYTYDLPGWDMDVRYAFAAFDGSFHERFNQSFGDFTLEGPTSGSFSISKSGILPANEVSIIHYTIYTDGFDSTGLLATGSGDIQFTLRPVPEPATVMLVILAGTVSRARIRRRCAR